MLQIAASDKFESVITQYGGVVLRSRKIRSTSQPLRGQPLIEVSAPQAPGRARMDRGREFLPLALPLGSFVLPNQMQISTPDAECLTHHTTCGCSEVTGPLDQGLVQGATSWKTRFHCTSVRRVRRDRL